MTLVDQYNCQLTSKNHQQKVKTKDHQNRLKHKFSNNVPLSLIIRRYPTLIPDVDKIHNT